MSIRHARIEDLPARSKAVHEGYEYIRRDFVPRRPDGQCLVSIYEIPPKKAAYPYHYHVKNEETFFILRGEGVLKTPEGERKVTAGDFLYFPADSTGAHKLTNTSEDKPLVYIDFDTTNELDVSVYPDSNKIGVWGKDINRVYQMEEDVDYYKGE